MAADGCAPAEGTDANERRTDDCPNLELRRLTSCARRPRSIGSRRAVSSPFRNQLPSEDAPLLSGSAPPRGRASSAAEGVHPHAYLVLSRIQDLLRRAHSNQDRDRNDEGFSFAQVIVTMVIVGILGGIGTFAAFQYIGQSRETVLSANIQTAAAAVQNTLALNPGLKIRVRHHQQPRGRAAS